jgi:uncharacterized protein YkwD
VLVAVFLAGPALAQTVSAPPPLVAPYPGIEPIRQVPLPPADAQGGPVPTFEDRVMELVNQERLANGGLAPLKRHPQLDQAAELHSVNMGVRNFFAHCDPDTRKLPWDRMVDAGYIWVSAAENAAAGATTPESVMSLWMNSPGHRANILSTGNWELGIGYAEDPPDQRNVRQDQNNDCNVDGALIGPFFRYWTQNFGRRNLGFPLVIEREAFATGSRNVNLYVYGSGWAQEMRLRNESGPWTSWMPYATNVAWQLSAGGGQKTVSVELRQGSQVRSAADTIHLTGAPLDDIFTDGFESGGVGAWSSSQ